ncbi:MAG TPA: C45 family peptidase [Actinomycetota bacterium]|nr:C45 family peptidase [Actinomycetota bacterium]
MIPVVRVSGGPEERGRAAGKALAEPIHRSLAFYRGYLERRGVRLDSLPRLLRPFRSSAEAGLPEMVAEMDALAEGAGADPWEIFAVNAFEELEPALSEPSLERCTSFTAASPGATILAHNEQWLAGDLGNVAVIVAAPTDGPAFVSPTVVTCLPAVGMNSAGIAQAIMSLTAGDDREGVPRVLVSRHSLQASYTADAIKRAGLEGRAGGYAHMFAGGSGEAFTVETTADRIAVLEGPGAHTNHYLHQDLTLIGDRPREGSRSRLERADALLGASPPTTPQDAMTLLADHEGDPQPICVHPDPKDGDDAEAVVFSMVCHLEERRMWVAPGPPCFTPFEEIEVA